MLPLPGLSPASGKPVVVKFDGGLLSSDGGVLALREVEQRLRLADRLAACIVDPRDPDQVTHHEMPVHHTLEEYLDAYIEAAGLKGEPKSSLFRASNGKTGILSERPFDRKDAFAMVQRRARAAGIKTKIGCHTFRATGITIYLTNGGDLEKAQQMAAHESPRTTKLYDRRSGPLSKPSFIDD